VVPLTLETAQKSAKIYADLRKSGISIGHSDIMIAAAAITHKLTLVTNNTRHFQHIPELDYLSWL